MAETLDVWTLKSRFPALKRTYHGKSAVYLDGPGGSQVVSSAIEAMVGYMSRGGANLHGVFPSSHETERIIAQAREGMATFLGADADEIAFGPNMTTLTMSISRALGRTWKPGDEIVVTEMDHRANVDPWVRAAADAGATVRWIPANVDTLTLDTSQLDDLINPRTKLVAVGLASNAVGTVTDVAEIAKRTHAVGAIVAVDAVHAAPHMLLHRDTLGADILLCSAYKFFGPHVGIAAIRRDVFQQLQVYKLAPAPTNIPECLETGTQNHEGIAGIVGALEFLQSLGSGDSPRQRLAWAMASIHQHEDALAARIRTALHHIPGITLYEAADDVLKTPTIAFRIDGHSTRAVCEFLAERHSVFVADGDFYASTLAQRLGIADKGGWVRAGLAPYNTLEDISRFIGGVRDIANVR